MSSAAISVSHAYRDRKRYLWLLSIFVPALMNAGPLLYLLVSPRVLWLWLPVAFNYIVMPLVDFVVGEDPSNPPESEVAALEEDRYYRYITYAIVPVLWTTYIFAAWFVARHPIPWYGVLAVILTAGSAGGYSINVGHELGHKQTGVERWLAKIILAPTGYGHFTIEHNRGHHIDVATPGDSASARMGEGIWRFALREMPGAVMRAWSIEKQRLARHRHSAWSSNNDILQSWLITFGFYAVMIAWLGLRVLPFLILSALWANFQLTSANYVEHYGLLRRTLTDGSFERCQPRFEFFVLAARFGRHGFDRFELLARDEIHVGEELLHPLTHKGVELGAHTLRRARSVSHQPRQPVENRIIGLHGHLICHLYGFRLEAGQARIIAKLDRSCRSSAC